MKKSFILLIIIAMFSLSVYANGYILFVGVGYGHGQSSFFDESEANYNYDGKTFVEKRKNNLGFDFTINLSIPLTEKLSIIPGFSVTAGNQEYSYKEITSNPYGENNAESFSFNLFSGDVILSYDLFKLHNDIAFNLLGGINYNIFNTDNGMGIEDTKYFGAIIGAGIKFLQTSQFDLVINATYNLAFNKEMPSFIRGQAGLRYKF